MYLRSLVTFILLTVTMPALAGPSVYRTAPPDPKAVTVKGVADGKADDSVALQQALDAVSHRGAGGIVFLPSGRYRLTRTIYIWPGVRLLGVGATRPVLVLADRTPGFQAGVKNMVIFSGRGPETTSAVPGRKPPFPPPGSVPFNDAVADASPDSFYPAMGNIDIEIGQGNEGAAAIRFHAAQHAYLAHMEFNLGSAFAGVYMVANEAEDLHFHGGRYGIVTEKPSPAWSFTLVDSSFDGQRAAAIREHEAGLTMVNVSIANTPIGIEIDRGYGDWLYGQDVRFENVSNAAVVVSNEDTAYTQVCFDNAIATGTPVFARFRDSGKTVGRPGIYKVTEFTHGLTLPAINAMGRYETRFKADALAAVPPVRPNVIRALPPTDQWVDVTTLGAKGDGKSDDTAALKAAIAAHRVLYFPSGFYRVTDTLLLKPETVLIGLNPSSAQVVLPDGTEAFQGIGTPRALVEAPKGGDNIVVGLGLFTGGINPRATALLWKAGATSLVNDVKIQGGHGTYLIDGTRFNPYDAYRTADADPRKRWDAQYHSIWVTDGGGGTFVNVWSPSTYAQSGFYISDTTTPGRVLQLSAEHHSRVEIELERAENWELLAPQTEEEVGESADALSLDIRNSKNILVANYHGYRVTRTEKPAPTAVRLERVSGIRFRNVHVNAESSMTACDGAGCTTIVRANKFPYENAITDVTHGIEVREREFAVLDVTGKPAPVLAPPAVSRPPVKKLADGFWSISGGAVGPDGKLWFVERKYSRILGWTAAEGLTVERNATHDPVSLAVDKSGHVIVLSSLGPTGTVYTFRPGSRADELSVIPPTPAGGRPGIETAIPANFWYNGEFMDRYDPAADRFTTLADLFAAGVAKPPAQQFVSPDGSLALPAYRTFPAGPLRWSDAMHTYGFVTAKPGSRVFVSNASEGRTYSGLLGENGAVTDVKPFVNRGGESVAKGPDGRIYVANGQIFVYATNGQEVGRIDVPARPIQVLFGGPDGRTLFILTHHALFAVRP